MLSLDRGRVATRHWLAGNREKARLPIEVGQHMKILIATDAWHPQISGVVRTLESLAKAVRPLGSTLDFLTPDGFASLPLPTYPGLRCALPTPAAIASRIERVRPDAIHVATEGPIGFFVRRYCLQRALPFTTSFTTRFPEYIAARVPFPVAWSYAALRRFHAPAVATMVSTPTLAAELTGRGFQHLRMWSRGVDNQLFQPSRKVHLRLPRPIFMSVGRIAPEKNLEAFLTLPLPGSKVVIGEGPQEADLRARFPHAHFLGSMGGEQLAAHMAAADVFVFPSKTDTFGIVQLEALSCGVPVAAYPVTGPLDVIGDNPVGILDADLERACRRALALPREACRAHALRFSWQASAAQFLSHVSQIGVAAFEAAPEPEAGWEGKALGSLKSDARWS
jgi:glycosyltransferase involved in cell wall biosynthesis